MGFDTLLCYYLIQKMIQGKQTIRDFVRMKCTRFDLFKGGENGHDSEDLLACSCPLFSAVFCFKAPREENKKYPLFKYCLYDFKSDYKLETRRDVFSLQCCLFLIRRWIPCGT